MFMGITIFRSLVIAGPNFVPEAKFDKNLEQIGSWILEAIHLTGPNAVLGAIRWDLKTTSELMEKLTEYFDERHFFQMPDNYGNFPDTTGYLMERWQDLKPELEDSNTYPWMTKCIDAVVEFSNRRWGTLDRLGYKGLGKVTLATRFGGRLFAAIGIVQARPPEYEQPI